MKIFIKTTYTIPSKIKKKTKKETGAINSSFLISNSICTCTTCTYICAQLYVVSAANYVHVTWNVQFNSNFSIIILLSHCAGLFRILLCHTVYAGCMPSSMFSNYGLRNYLLGEILHTTWTDQIGER